MLGTEPALESARRRISLATKKSATKGEGRAARPTIGTSHTGARPKARATAAAGPAKKKGTAAATKRAPTKKAGLDKSRAKPTAPRRGEAKRAREEAQRQAAPTSVRRKVEPRAVPSGVVNESAKIAAVTVATAALDKKAVNVQIFDVAGRVDYADYLVLMSGRAERHVVAIADAIEESLLKLTPKRKPQAVEGRTPGNWIILDFGDVIAHVFLEEARSFYDFDALWHDARRVPLPAEPRPS
jgi:ribosome-associated protein